MISIIKSPKVNIVLDASKLDSFETCPAKFNMRHNLNKTLSVQFKSDALDKGSLAHGGLEVYYKELSKGTHYDDRMSAALMKIREMSSNVSESNLDESEVSILLAAIEQSCDFWRAEDENSLEVLAVEQPFAYELFSDDEIRIIISGKIDLLVNFRGLGGSASYEGLPIDHKTYSRESMLLRKSNQFINYCNAVGSNYLIVNRIGLQKSKSAEEKFKRLPLSYDPLYIKAWKDNLIKMILNGYLSCVADNYWPEVPSSCNKFMRLCEYYQICDSSGTLEDKLAKLNREYSDGEPWDVTKGLTSGD